MISIVETNLGFKQMDTREKTERIILHHAAISNCTPEQIHNWHLNNGWSGAGYHFLVRKDGKIYRLRPEDCVGAHAFGANYNSIGICLEGNFETEYMSKEQINSLCELLKDLEKKYNINIISKHNDINATVCPGRNFKFDEIVQNVHENKHIKIDVTGIIAQIQKEINNKYNLNIVIDNIYGKETKGALVYGLQHELNVQFNKGLKEDKIFGPKTKQACINVTKGATGNITYLIQAMLICHSFNLKADGIFGENTLKAVKELQRRNKITIDGIVGKNTFNVLLK